MKRYNFTKKLAPLCSVKGISAFSSIYTRFFFAFLFLCCTQVHAQGPDCTVTCKSDVSISLGTACTGQVRVADLIEPLDDACNPNILLVLQTANGTNVDNNNIPSQYLGQTLKAHVIVLPGSNNCWSNVSVTDDTPPVIACHDVTVNCTQSTSIAAIGTPTVSDNCSAGPVTLFAPSDIFTNNGQCSDPFVKKILRLWRAIDASDNIGNCSQLITVQRPSLGQITAPPRFDTIAMGTVANPSLTGRPTIQGQAIDQAACTLFDQYNDFDTVTVCQQGATVLEYVIHREWTVFNPCQNQVRRDTQLISIKDLTPPTITCPTNLTLNALPDQCNANIDALPAAPAASDPVTVQWQFGNGFGPWANIPKGVYTLTYRATDCSNVATCTTQLTIKDGQVPIAKCIANRVFGLSGNGGVTIQASAFNAGSSDNCGQVSLAVSRGGEFGPSVTFNCADAGAQIPVVLRVSEANNAASNSTCTVLVTIQDNLEPSLTSFPPDVTVDCNADLNSLPGIAPPVFTDNCAMDTVIYTLERNVTACGNGTAKRIFRAYDQQGNLREFIQHITVLNLDVLTEGQIVWPTNYTSNQCGASLVPIDLPVANREPTFVHPGCAQISVTYSDQLFNTAAPACYKVFRNWTVIDACQYTGGTTGKWEHAQLLEVSDQQAPALLAPANVTVQVGNDCQHAQVNLSAAVATDCSPSVNVVNNSPYATVAGANASGWYPIGTHTVVFRASDGCGNQAQKIVKITVTDNLPPTAVCVSSLSVNLASIGGDPFVTVNASIFDAGSYDACAPASQLVKKIKKANSPAQPNEQITFTCSDIGNRPLEYYVTDNKGNTAHCNTNVLVQDNNHLCGEQAPSQATIAGKVVTETDLPVKGVNVRLSNYASASPVLTDSTGAFSFANLPLDSTYIVTPEKDSNDLNGVSTYDLLLIKKHLLGTDSLDSPYKIIAADVSHNGTVSSFDGLELKKLILGIYTALPSNTSWRFVDKNFHFANPYNPFATAFPETKTVADLSADSTVQFIGVKIGDVNNSVHLDEIMANTADRAQIGDFALLVQDQALRKGEQFAFALSPNKRSELGGMAFTLEYDPEKLILEDGVPGFLPDMNSSDFHFMPQMGKVSVCWVTPYNEGVETDTRQPLLLFKGRAYENMDLSQALRMVPTPTRPEAIGSNGEGLGLGLQFSKADGSLVPAESQYALYQNQPNPFDHSTQISFQLPVGKTLRLTVFDASGRVILDEQQSFDAGYHAWTINARAFPTSGVYAYRVQTDDWTATRKMVRE